MKKLFFLILLLAGNTAFAQDYAPLPDTGIRRYFTNSAGYLRGIRVDSVVQENGYKRYVTFRTARGWKNSYTLADSNGACWIGKNVRAYANGDWHFPNVSGDTILVKTGAKVGDTWAFHRDTSAIWTEATVLSIDTQTVFGVLDSVKRIQLTLKNGSTALPQNPISAFQVVLSKTRGFAQVPDLYLFPYKDLNLSNRDYWYQKLKSNSLSPTTFETLLFSHVNGWNLPARQIYDLQAGDVTYTERRLLGLSTESVLDTVVSRQDVPAFTEYTYNSWSWRVSYIGLPLTVQHGTKTVQKTNELLFDTLHMPEEYYNGHSNYLYINFNDSSFCNRSLLIEHIVGGGKGLYINTPLPFREEYKYKKGPGLVYYRYADSDGQSIDEDLYSYSKNGILCGNIPAVPSGMQDLAFKAPTFGVYPQPATTEVFVQAPQIRYPATIRIQNLQGQLLSQQEISVAGKPISTANLPAGLYLLSVTDAGGNSAVQKLLIEAN